MVVTLKHRQHPYNYKGTTTKSLVKLDKLLHIYPPIIDKLVLRWKYPDEYHHGLMTDAVSQMLMGNSPFTKGEPVKTYKLCVTAKINGNPVRINSKEEAIRIEFNPAKLGEKGVAKLGKLLFEHLFVSHAKVYSVFLKQAELNRIDVAYDIGNMPIDRLGHLVTSKPQPVKQLWISKKKGVGETYYYGKRTADRQIAIYDKLSKAAKESTLFTEGGLDVFYKHNHKGVTRVEYREKEAGTLEAHTITKHLNRLRLYDYKSFSLLLSKEPEQAKRTFWLLFQHTTLATALSTLEQQTALRYQKAVDGSLMKVWTPASYLDSAMIAQVIKPLKQALKT